MGPHRVAVTFDDESAGGRGRSGPAFGPRAGPQEHGYVVDAVADGAAALGYLRSYEYEAVVLDWRMPATNGLEVVTSDAGRSGDRTPVLMLTARDATADRVRGSTRGPTTTWSSRSPSPS